MRFRYIYLACYIGVSKNAWLVFSFRTMLMSVADSREYDGPGWELINDARLNRGLLEFRGKYYHFQDLPPLHDKLETLFAMLHPKNLCSLLSENVEDAAKHWMYVLLIVIKQVPF